MQNWGALSQALALAPVSVAVRTLTSSCSPENTARSQQLFLPGMHCLGHLPCSCNLLSSPSWRLLVLYPCALQDTLEIPSVVAAGSHLLSWCSSRQSRGRA